MVQHKRIRKLLYDYISINEPVYFSEIFCYINTPSVSKIGASSHILANLLNRSNDFQQITSFRSTISVIGNKYEDTLWVMR
tara:strand:- start:1548 stop:1790 length:243 start_codon:yes stop_codon:yes gene_type:complete